MLLIIQGGLELGLILAIMAVGMFISFRVLNTPDLTVDGSFTLGNAVSAVFALHGMPILGIVISLFAGAFAGIITGFLQTKLKIQPILAGILTMTALYSINLRIMENKPNITLINKNSIFTPFQNSLPSFLANLIPIAILLLLVCILLRFFLKTQIGMSIRATGDNEDMVRASSINSDFMKILGLSCSNALVALSGAIMAQYQSFGDINIGIGMMVIGLASIIVGEVFCPKGSITKGIVSAVIGAVIYRFMLTAALQIGMSANDLKLFSALLVIIAISIPVIRSIIVKRRGRHA